ncbi:MAG: hypothetical protein D4Q79_00145 [Spirochaetia bacterium]|nr:MAG: hypothetical protein D4Q79_00145 [Spirochaetia bacterium]
MNIPNLPTDNLYKFMAIFGLVIIISGFYFYTTIIDKYSLAASSLIKEEGILKIETDYLSDEVALLETRIEIANGQGDKNILNNVLADYKAVKDELKQKEIARESIEQKIYDLEFIEKDVNAIKAYHFGAIGLGMVLMVYGFWLWYSKLQYYQDLIIRREVGGIEIKNKKTWERLIGTFLILVLLLATAILFKKTFENYYSYIISNLLHKI